MALLIMVMALAPAGAAEAQVPLNADPGGSTRTRADLESLLERYEQVLASPAYSDDVKATFRVEADRIRSRLELGDFRLGDRIVLSVEGEPDLPDTLAVQTGPTISLPVFGEISLRGVLRSEVEGEITEALSRFIREPVVRAEGLMRVSIQGAVGRPGYYVVPAQMLLGEALMVAGGPAQNARVDDVWIERGPDVLLSGEELQQAIRDGLSLDQLNLQAGDQIVMPERGEGLLRNIGIVAGVIGSVSILIFRLSR